MSVIERIKADTLELLRFAGDPDPSTDYLTDELMWDLLAATDEPAAEEIESRDSGDSLVPAYSIIYGSKILRIGPTVKFLWVDMWNGWRCTNQAKTWSTYNVNWTSRTCGGYNVYQLIK